MRNTPLKALVLAAAMATTCLPSSFAAPPNGVGFVIVGDTVTIYDATPVVRVGLRDLTETVARLDATSREHGPAAANTMLASLPRDLARAVVWDTVHVIETPPEDDVDNATAGDEEPPATPPSDPVRPARDLTGGNYTTPSPVCTWYHVTDTRTMKGKITRFIKYRFKLTASWRGCDNATNNTAEPVTFFYSDIQFGWRCTNDAIFPKKSVDGYNSPYITFSGLGECFPEIDAGPLGKITAGRKQPSIHNSYSYTGARVTRIGAAG